MGCGWRWSLDDNEALGHKGLYKCFKVLCLLLTWNMETMQIFLVGEWHELTVLKDLDVIIVLRIESDGETGRLVRRILQKRAIFKSWSVFEHSERRIYSREVCSTKFGGENKRFSLGNVDVVSVRHPMYMLSRHLCFYKVLFTHSHLLYRR